MAQSTRFGRRLPLPSTRRIIHELRVFSAHEDARKAKVDEDASRAPAGIEADGQWSGVATMAVGVDH